MISLLKILCIAPLLVLALAGCGYYGAALLAALRFLALRRRAATGFAPGVSILKSLKGADPAMLEAFRSHCRQNYSGDFEMLFGVSSLDDEAVPIVRALQQEFPQRSLQLIECPQSLGSNGKVSTLIQLARHARYDFLLINDSDITVSPTYLRSVMGGFREQNTKDPRPVGMVTALYRGRAHGSLWSWMEALGIATDFQASVLVAHWMEGGLHYGLGSTLAVRRDAVQAIGGLEVLVNQLADDYELGYRIDQSGFRIVLAPEAVETSVPAYDWTGFQQHQLRWLRTVRDARPAGYVGMIFTHGLAWSLLAATALGFSLWACVLLGVALCLRMMLAFLAGSLVLADTQIRIGWALLPLRDLVALGLWAAGLRGNTIVWRGERFRLHRGVLTKEEETRGTKGL